MKKGKQCNGQKKKKDKMTNNDLQHTKQKTKDREIRTPQSNLLLCIICIKQNKIIMD
jgi:hypothetical protein